MGGREAERLPARTLVTLEHGRRPAQLRREERRDAPFGERIQKSERPTQAELDSVVHDRERAGSGEMMGVSPEREWAGALRVDERARRIECLDRDRASRHERTEAQLHRDRATCGEMTLTDRAHEPEWNDMAEIRGVRVEGEDLRTRTPDER